MSFYPEHEKLGLYFEHIIFEIRAMGVWILNTQN